MTQTQTTNEARVASIRQCAKHLINDAFGKDVVLSELKVLEASPDDGLVEFHIPVAGHWRDGSGLSSVYRFVYKVVTDSADAISADLSYCKEKYDNDEGRKFMESRPSDRYASKE